LADIAACPWSAGERGHGEGEIAEASGLGRTIGEVTVGRSGRAHLDENLGLDELGVARFAELETHALLLVPASPISDLASMPIACGTIAPTHTPG
jgi:hypothetical protein